MNKTILKLVGVTAVFITLTTLLVGVGLTRIIDQPATQIDEPVVEQPMTRGLPAPASIDAPQLSDDELVADIAAKQHVVILLLGVILLAVLFSITMIKLALQPLREVLEKQKQFVADASHELKTPLSLMSSEIQLFQERHMDTTPTKESIYTFTQHILFDVHRLTAITNDMLQLVKLDNDTKKKTGETITLKQIDSYLESLQGKIKLRYPTHTVQFTSEINDNMTLHASPTDLMQVVEILAENACLHTPENTEVEMVQTLENDQYQLRISDNGQGIASEHVEQLFVRFFQVDTSGDRPGTGLGLPIAKELTEHWNGSLLVDSEVGIGTTMTLVLPAQKLS